MVNCNPIFEWNRGLELNIHDDDGDENETVEEASTVNEEVGVDDVLLLENMVVTDEE